jgi:DNA-binding transcriptional LysR family regulator
VTNLFEEPADLAVRIGELADSSLVASRLGSIRRVVCASPGYFAARGTPQTPHELSGHDCITSEGLVSPKTWTFRAGKSDIAVPIHSRLTVNTAEAATGAAIAGVGIARVLSYQIAQALEDGSLVTALERFEPSPAPVSLVYAGQGLLPLKLRAFMDFAGPRLKATISKLAATCPLG